MPVSGRLTILSLLLALPALAAASLPATLQNAIGNPSDFTLSGSVRARFEALDGQFRPGLDAGDNALLLRTTLAAGYHAAGFRIGAELFDSRAYLVDRNSSVGSSDVNSFELVQAYVGGDFGALLGEGTSTTATAGRFTLDLGSRRLVARNDFRNTTNAFTGVHVDWQGPGQARLTLLYALPQLRLPADHAAVLANRTEFDHEGSELRFWGAFFSAPKLLPYSTLDLYVFGLEENDSAGRPTRNRHLRTPGARLFNAPAPGEYDYELEGAWQSGTLRDGTAAAAPKLDVAAYFVHAQVGRSFRTTWSPRIALAYDRASGDERGARRYHRFDPLFGARRFDFGPTSLYGPFARTNLSSPELRLEFRPAPRWDGLVAYRAAWLASSTGSFSNTGVRDASGKAGDFGGQQIETRARYWLVPERVRIEAGAAELIDGRFLDEAPNRAGHGNTLYGYLSLLSTF